MWSRYYEDRQIRESLYISKGKHISKNYLAKEIKSQRFLIKDFYNEP